MERDGGFGSGMQEASEPHLSHATEMESMKSGDAAPNSPHIMNPLLKGCLNGQLLAVMNYGFNLITVYESYLDPNPKKFCHGSAFQILRSDFLISAIHRTATLGVFEILMNKLRNGSDGKTLSLYQEACCGLTSGAVGAVAIQPLTLALHRVGLQSLTYPNWFTSLSHIVKKEGALALWRGSGWSMSTQAAAQMGLLTSYFRSRNYLIESQGLSEWNAQTCASIISGFFATVFGHPLHYAKAINDAVMQYRDGNRNIHRKIPACVCMILIPYSGAKFYLSFLKCFGYNACFCMMHWWIYEEIRKASSSSSSSSSSKDLMV